MNQRILKKYQKNIFYKWKNGPEFWNVYGIDLENLSDDQFIEEFMHTFEHDPFVHEGDAYHWEEYLEEALHLFYNFLKKYPEEVAKMRRR